MSSGLLESLLADALTPVTRDETVPIPDFRTVRDQTITRPSPDLPDPVFRVTFHEITRGEGARASSSSRICMAIS